MEIRLLKIVNNLMESGVFYLRRKKKKKFDATLLLHAANRNVFRVYFYLNGAT